MQKYKSIVSLNSGGAKKCNLPSFCTSKSS